MDAIGKKKANKETEPTTKGAQTWRKIRKARAKVITFLSEENEQETARVLQELIEDYKKNGRVSAERQIRVHVDPATNRYVCPVCANKFLKEGNLMSHVELTHMATASDRASQIRQRRFGFENRSVKLIARIEQIRKSIKDNSEPLANLNNHPLVSPETSVRKRHTPRRKSQLEVPTFEKNPGRKMYDEDENAYMEQQLTELQMKIPRKKSHQRARNSEISSPGRPIERMPSNESRLSISSSIGLGFTNRSSISNPRSPDQLLRVRIGSVDGSQVGFYPFETHDSEADMASVQRGSPLPQDSASSRRPSTSPSKTCGRWLPDAE